MALKVIGAGLGRTGTESLKKALEYLGYGKCYHMFELLKDSTMLEEWQKLRKGEVPDYDLLFRYYESSVDFPAAIYYREFMKQYPEAKVILTVRDADKWYDSAAKTIFKGMPKPVYYFSRFTGMFIKKVRLMLRVYDYAQDIVNQDFFNGRIEDREYCKKVFNDWNALVKRTVSADKLLVFEVKDGWGPLCRFLGVPVPGIPFPKSNDSENFDKNIAKKVRENLSQ